MNDPLTYLHSLEQSGIKFGLAGKLGNLVELEYHGVGADSQLKFNWGLSYDF